MTYDMEKFHIVVALVCVHTHRYTQNILLIKRWFSTVHTNLISKCNRLCSGHQKVSYFGYFPCHEWSKNVIAFSRKRALGNPVQTICCSIPIGNYQTDYLLAVAKMQQSHGRHYTVLYSILPFKMADVQFIFVYYRVINCTRSACSIDVFTEPFLELQRSSHILILTPHSSNAFP